ncbi:MAG: tyrosine-type recombinase/integrase [Anaerolineae bacterium]
MGRDPRKFTSRKVKDSLTAWAEHYRALVLEGTRQPDAIRKTLLHLQRFVIHMVEAYGHDRASRWLPRDTTAWRDSLAVTLAPSTVNGHLASLSGFATWVQTQAPELLAAGNPLRGIGELGLPPLEPHALTEPQVRSLKNLCDRLERFHQHKGRRRSGSPTLRAHSRPSRDRAIIYVLLSTGLRRQELVSLDLEHLVPGEPSELRRVKVARVRGVRGKARSQRTVFLSADARTALADYLEGERAGDADSQSRALFLSARGLPARSPDGRMSGRAINHLVAQIGRWHDSEIEKPERRLGALRPHVLRHTFAYRLAKATGSDTYELERRLGHRSQRYLQRYTNPPEDVAAQYVEPL